MSKLYEKYKSFKKLDNQTIYLFKSGIFYIFLSNDAILMSQLLNLKLTNLNSNILKCGFPQNSIDRYLYKIECLGYNLKIIDSNNISTSTNEYSQNKTIKNFIEEISNIDVDNLSIKEAYDFIYKIKIKSNDLLKTFK